MSTSEKQFRVLKFGGTSVGSSRAIRRTADVVERSLKECRPVLVVSALATVTDTLEGLIDSNDAERSRATADKQSDTDVSTATDDCAATTDDYAHTLKQLIGLHIRTASELLSPRSLPSYERIVRYEVGLVIPPLRRLVARIGTRFDREQIRATGERLSTPLVASFLADRGLDARSVDASSLVRMNADNRTVDSHQTTVFIQSWATTLSASLISVITGFIGGTACGNTLTLGRGGSDFTAALLASALGADRMERWTDVDGIFTSDPRSNPSAKLVNVMRMEDAALLNSANRLGMHRHTLEPLLTTRTPLRVRSLRGTGLGTLVIPSGGRRGSTN